MTDGRLTLRHSPHMKALADFVDALRQRGLDVPDLDPSDGGTEARAIFLLESPGPKAVGSRYISSDNPDPSARNMKSLLQHAGFQRNEVALWNVVPQCVSTVDQNRNATAKDIRAALRDTQDFIDLFSNLSVIVLCGRKAQTILRYRADFPYVASPEDAANRLFVSDGVPILSTFHPGAMSYNRLPNRIHMQETFKRAHQITRSPSGFLT